MTGDGSGTLEWIVEKTLGTGGFGQVTLWRNESTNETLAVKKCRLGNDPKIITAKHRDRWNLEVEIMQKLNHPNVVAALPVPAQLRAPPDEMPVLAMEYCSKGDLRKILNAPENCCGLSETQVRRLLRHVSGALAHLHSRRIIHRDVKPENIMVQEDAQGKFVYKLTDLGYAKELDQLSVCDSFVGTLQYLVPCRIAPELFMSQEYTCTVDYWSFGLVAHECMVGVRPFLPSMAPAEWMKHVCRKKSTDVCVYTSRDGTVRFSEHIFKENHLCEPFVARMERWLRLMLEWQPHKRGIDPTSGGSGGTKRFITHSMLEDALDKKIVHCFVVATGELLSYEIQDATTTRQVLQWVSRDVGVASQDLACLSPRGDVVDDDRAAVGLHCDDPMEDEEWMCYAFDKKDDVDVDRRVGCVDARIAAATEILAQRESTLRRWSLALHFVSTETKLEKRFLHAFRAYGKYLNAINSAVLNAREEMLLEMNKIKLVRVNADKAEYDQANRMHRLSSHQLEESLYRRAEDIAALVDNVQDAVTRQDLTINTIHLQQQQQQQQLFVDDDDGINAEKLYERASKAYRESKSSSRGHDDECWKEMAVVMSHYVCRRDERTKRHSVRLRKNRDCERRIAEALASFDDITKSIRKANLRLTSLQIDRQKLIWKAFNTLVTTTTTTSRSASLVPFRGEDESSSYEPVSLKSIVSKISRDSSRTIKENHDLRSKWSTQLSSLNRANETLNWDFLDEIKKETRRERNFTANN
uniref:IkappaB kinase n=1 Tax=Strigamia maritima TaxID=126957 RepID=T1INV2_STRMM